MDKYNIKKPFNVLVCCAILLSVVGIVLTFINAKNGPTLRTVVVYVGYLVIIYYTTFGYKIPHSNLLKYLMLGFGVLLGITSFAVVVTGMPITGDMVIDSAIEGFNPTPDKSTIIVGSVVMAYKALLLCLVSMLVGYVAGRLHKFDQNKWFLTIILTLLICRVLLSIGDRGILLADLNEVFMWFDIECAYFLRYHEHKEAGLTID